MLAQHRHRRKRQQNSISIREEINKEKNEMILEENRAISNGEKSEHGVIFGVEISDEKRTLIKSAAVQNLNY